MYEPDLQRGVKKKTIPSPRVVDFAKSALYEEVLQQAKDIFFREDEHDLGDYCLAGPSGVPFQVDDPTDWVLYEFLKQHGFQPSKLCLYIMYKPEVGIMI